MSEQHKVVVVHLSDLHVREGSDPVLARADLIAAAVHEFDGCGHCIVAVTGDLAYSGTSEQHKLVVGFLHALESALRQRLSTLESVRFALVPGNHDLEHDRQNTIRDLVVRSLSAPDSSVPPAEDQLHAALAPLAGFFNEAREITDLPAEPSLCWREAMQCGERTVEILMLNTAWMSSRKEKQGSLRFPAQVIPESSDADLVVALMHHPHNWLRAEDGRSLMRGVRRVADVLLAGHEHDGEHTAVTHRDGASVEISGDALQPHGDGARGSAFAVLEVDIDSKSYSWQQFKWTRTKYSRNDSAPLRPLPLSHERKTAGLRLTPDCEAFLEDPGVHLDTPTGTVQLRDVIVPPSIREEDPFLTRKFTPESADDLVEHLVVGAPVAVLGDERAGRTSLAKYLFRVTHGRGLVPLYLDAAKLTGKQLEDPAEACAAAFVHLYGESRDTYLQLERERQLTVIDNLDLVSPAARSRLLVYASRRGRTLVFANTSAGFDFLRDCAEAGDIRFFRLLPLSRAQREKLVVNWQRCQGVDPHDRDAVRRRDDILRVFDVILGRSFLPAQPFYLLAVLGSMETSDASSRQSTHGYFYEILIRTHLAQGLSGPQFDVVLTYLANIAWSVFSRGHDWFSEKDWRIFHAEYTERFAVSRDRGEMKDYFSRRSIICGGEDEYRFRYPYMFYYFVALYMRDNIGESAVKEMISTLAGDLSRSKHADVLLFLAHLSRDETIIDAVLSAAEGSFEGAPEATLGDDTKFVKSMGFEFTPLVIEEPDPRRSRIERLELMDAGDKEGGVGETELPEDGDEVADVLAELRRSLHSIDILGQILKNFPGSLHATRKLQVAMTGHRLSMRIVGSVLESVRQNEQVMVDEFAAVFQARHPGWSEEQARDSASRTIVSLAAITLHGVISRVARAMGSIELSKTYDQMIQEDPSNAMKMLDLTLKLEQYRVVPERSIDELARDLRDNPLPLSVVRDLVLDHLHMFPVAREVRQRVCASLDIEWKSVRGKTGDLALPPAGGDKSKRTGDASRRSGAGRKKR